MDALDASSWAVAFAIGFQILTCALSVVLLVLTAWGLRGRYANNSWVLNIQGLLTMALLVGAAIFFFVGQDPLNSRDFLRMYAVRPEVLLAQFILYLRKEDVR